MTALFGSQTSTDFAVIHLDHADPTQFWYRPKHVDVILGDTLGDFGVTYWGIGKPFLSRNSSTGEINSLMGAVLSGKARIDVTGPQRDAMIAEIKRAYGVSNPKIAPLRLTNTRVQPVIASQTLQLADDADIVFPQTVDLGSDFTFTVGTGKGLFAVFATSKNKADSITTNPAFGINVYGKTEFVGEPWECKIRCNLRQVWDRVRQSYGGSVSYGWFKVAEAEYNSCIQSLVRDKVIETEFIEGSMDTEKYGRQILEMGKDIFTAVNAQANAGDGYFKFEPIPGQAALMNSQLFGFGWWGWSCSVNASYSHDRFTQDIEYKNTLRYTGRFQSDVSLGMTLAVKCGSATGKYFNDLCEPDEPCTTQSKVDRMNDRLAKELNNPRRNELLDKIFLMYIQGQITEAQWIKAKIYLNQHSFQEDSSLVKGSVRTAANRLLSLGDECYVQGMLPDIGIVPTVRNCECNVEFDPSLGASVARGLSGACGNKDKDAV